MTVENSDKPLKETRKNLEPKKPRAKKTYPKKAESGPGIAGNPEKYKEAHNKYEPKEKIGKPTLGTDPITMLRKSASVD